MKIINKIDFGTLSFYCEHCETTTEANSGEYHQAKGNDIIDHKPSNRFIKRLFFSEKSRELKPVWNFEILCPTCSNHVKLSRSTGNKSIFVKPPTDGSPW